MACTVIAVNLVPMRAYSTVTLRDTSKISYSIESEDVGATAVPNGTDGLFIVERVTSLASPVRYITQYFPIDVVFDGCGCHATWAVGRYGRGIRSLMELNRECQQYSDRGSNDEEVVKRLRIVTRDEEWSKLRSETKISELFDELLSDKLTGCVNSLLLPVGQSIPYNSVSDTMCDRQILAIVSSDINGYTSQQSICGSGESGGLLADTLARLIPYLNGKKKKKSNKKKDDYTAKGLGPQLKVRASIKRITFSSIDHKDDASCTADEEMYGALSLVKALREATRPVTNSSSASSPDGKSAALPAFESVMAAGCNGPFKLEDVGDIHGCRVIESVDDALDLVSDSRLFDEKIISEFPIVKTPPPYATFVALHLFPVTADDGDDRTMTENGNTYKQSQTSNSITNIITNNITSSIGYSNVYRDVIILFASFSNSPIMASKFASEMCQTSMYVSIYPIILFAIPDVFDSREQTNKAKQALEAYSDLRKASGQSHAFQHDVDISSVYDKCFPSANVCREFGELAAEIRLCRAATGPLEFAKLGLVSFGHTKKKRHKERYSAGGAYITIPTVQELCSEIVESHRKWRRQLEGQLLDTDAADAIYQRMCDDMTREVKRAKKSSVLLKQKIDNIKLDWSNERLTTERMTISNFDESDENEEGISISNFSADSVKTKQQKEDKKCERENKKLMANHEIMEVFYENVSVCTSIIQNFISEKRDYGRVSQEVVRMGVYTMILDDEVRQPNMINVTGDSEDAATVCFQSPSRRWFARQLVDDVVEYCVERATLIGEKVISIDESYSWATDIQGISSRVKPPSMWIEQPFNILITELHPSIDSCEMTFPDESCGLDDDDYNSDYTNVPDTNERDIASINTHSHNSSASSTIALDTNKSATKILGSPSRSNSEQSTTNNGGNITVPVTVDSKVVTQKYDAEEADKKYLMAVYDSLTLMQDVSRYLKAGTVMMKHGRNGSPHERKFWVTSQSFKVELMWVDPNKTTVDRSVVSTILLSDVESVILGPFSKVFKRHPITSSDSRFYLAFTLLTYSGRTVDIVAPTLPDFEAWVLGLAHIARVDPYWGSRFDLFPFLVEDLNLVSQLSAEERTVCQNHFIIPAQYIAVKDKVQQIRDEVHRHLRLFSNNEEHAFAALGGIHVPKTNKAGAILMTKGELRHHSKMFEIDIFRVCEMWKLFSQMDIIYDPDFTPPTSFGVTKRKAQ